MFVWLLFINFDVSFTLFEETRNKLCEEFLRIEFSIYSSILPAALITSLLLSKLQWPPRGKMNKHCFKPIFLDLSTSFTNILAFSWKSIPTGLPWNKLFLIHWKPFCYLWVGSFFYISKGKFSSEYNLERSFFSILFHSLT